MTRLSAALLCLLAGCEPAGEAFPPVAGRVAVGGRPLATGVVSFRPDAAKGNPSRHHPTGAVGPDGRYALTTVGRPGAPPGWYKVVVIAHEPVRAPVEPKWLTPGRYRDEKTTPLAVEVTAAPPPNAYDFDLAR